MTVKTFPKIGDIARVEYASGAVEFGLVSWACEPEQTVEVEGLGPRGWSAGMFPARMVRSVTAEERDAEIQSLRNSGSAT